MKSSINIEVTMSNGMTQTKTSTVVFCERCVRINRHASIPRTAFNSKECIIWPTFNRFGIAQGTEPLSIGNKWHSNVQDMQMGAKVNVRVAIDKRQRLEQG